MSMISSISPSQSPEALQLIPHNKLWVFEGQDKDWFSLGLPYADHLLALATLTITPSKNYPVWNELKEKLFYAKACDSFMTVVHAPLESVRNALWEEAHRNLVQHHYHWDNGLYAVWDTFDGRTIVVGVNSGAEAVMTIQVCEQALTSFERWEHGDLYNHGFHSSHRVKGFEPFRHLFEHIQAQRERKPILDAVQCSHIVRLGRKI